MDLRRLHPACPARRRGAGADDALAQTQPSPQSLVAGYRAPKRLRRLPPAMLSSRAGGASDAVREAVRTSLGLVSNSRRNARLKADLSQKHSSSAVAVIGRSRD